MCSYEHMHISDACRSISGDYSEVAIAGTHMKEMVSEEGKQQERATSDRPGSDNGVLDQFNGAQQPQQQEALLMSLNYPASSNETTCMAKETGDQGKKLQYVLRSNPKRSRRFLDPDYNSPHFGSSPVAPASTNISSSIATTNNTLTAAVSVPSPPPLAAITIKKPTSIFSEKARACTECGKEFHSWKALFGHMRCHPERQWRGIQPPSSSSSFPTKFKSSPATKRGKATQPRLQVPNESGRAQCTPILDESDTESIEAAYIHERDEDSPRAHKSSKAPLQNMCAQSFSTDPESEVIMDEQDMADCLVMLAFAAKGEAAPDRPSDSSCRLDVKLGQKVDSKLPLIDAEPQKAMKKRSWEKSIHVPSAGEKAAEFEDGRGDPCKSKFQCISCKKIFRSHQALGGHRASHKKVKGCFARTQAPEDTITPHVLQETDMTYTERTLAETQPEELPANASEKGEQASTTEEQNKRRMGQFLQFSISCHEKMEDDDLYDSAIAMDKKQVKHQSSSCSSSSSVIAGTPAEAGAALLTDPQQQQQPQTKLHQCTVCHRVFSTGQALGGHKRCHWGSSPAPDSTQKSSQDSDGGCEENPQLCLHVSMSDSVSELSRKDSCTFIVDQARIDGSSAVTENTFEQRPLFRHLDDTKDVQRWLGYVIVEGDTIASRQTTGVDGHCEAEKGPKECLQQAGHGGGHEVKDAFIESGAKQSRVAQLGRQQKHTSLLPKEELILDLNLPAPEEEAEESSSVFCKASFQPACPCIFSFLTPASNSFLCEGELTAHS